MTWLAWRLQRTEYLLLLSLCVALSGLLFATHADAVKLATTKCPVTDQPFTCQISVGWLYRLLESSLPWLNFLPLVVAMLLTLPFVAELENGTFRLAWTQGVTRRHWMLVRVGFIAIGGTVFATAFVLSFRYWSSPRLKIDGRVGGDFYDMLGTLPIAHTLVAIGLVAATGVVIRRLVPALFVSSIAYVGIRLPFMLWIRPNLVAPIKSTLDPAVSSFESTGWHLSSYWIDPAGKHISEDQLFQLCPPVSNMTRGILFDCITDHQLTRVDTYHPESHFWPLQLWETFIFLAIAITLIGFTSWYVLKRVE